MVATAVRANVLSVDVANVLSVDVDGICRVTNSTYTQGGGCLGVDSFATGTQYVFQITAYTGATQLALKAASKKLLAFSVGGSSNVGSFAFAQITDVPSQVTGVKATPVGPNQIAVIWDPAVDNGSPITQYTPVVIKRTASNVETTETLTATTATSFIYAATGATTDQYSFCVIATNDRGDSVISQCSQAISSISRPTTLANGLTATAGSFKNTSATTTPITISWSTSDTSTVTGWTFEYSLDGVAWTTYDSHVPAGATSKVVTGLPAGVVVNFRVAALNQAGIGSYTSASSMAYGTPDVPAFASKAISGGTFLYWTPPAHLKGRTVASYQILLNGSSACTIADTATSCTVTNLLNDTNYTFTLRTSYWNAEDSETDTVEATTSVIPAAAPAKPIRSSSNPIEGDGSVTFSWQQGIAQAGEGTTTGYLIQQLDAYGNVIGSGTTYAAHGGVETQTLTGLVNGTTYRWQIYATNASGSVRSSDALFIIATPRGNPGDVPSLVLIPSNGKIDASWSTPASDGGSAITGYQVTITSNGQPVTAPQCQGLTNSCTITGLTNGSLISLSVVAITAFGQSVHPATATATPSDVTAPVSGLTATSPASKQMRLSWTAPAGATSVKVERSADALTWTVDSATVTSSSYLDTALPLDGLNYFFRVTPSNGSSVGQATVISAMAHGPASAVSSLALNAGDQQLTVTWNAPTNNGGATITEYEVDYALSSAPNTWTTFIADSRNTGTSATITGLTNGTAYIVRVKAINSFGPGDAGSPSAPATPRPVPGTVANVIATPGVGVDVGSVTVSWSAQQDATGYLVSAKGSTGASWATACTITDPTVTSCIVRGLIAGHTYYFLVTAVNGSGSNSGTQASVTTNTLATLPTQFQTTLAQVTGLTLTPLTGTDSDKVQVRWNALQYADTYTVSVSGTDYNTLAPFICASATATTCTVSGLIGGRTYYFQVLGFGTHPVDGFGQSVPAQLSVLLPVYVPPAPAGGGTFTAPASPVVLPLPLSATSMTAKAGDRQVQLTWVAPADTNRSNWEIQSSTDGATWSTPIELAGTASTTVVGNLKNGTNYIFRAYPKGNNATNLPVTANAMPGIAATAPQNLSATPGDSSVILNWSAPTDAGGLPIKNYVVEQSTDGVTWTNVSSLDGTTLNTYIDGLTNFTAYNFRVYAVTDFGQGAAATLTTSPSVLPTAPITLKLTSVSSGALSVGWTPVTGGSSSSITGYKVEYSVDGKSWTSSGTTPAIATVATVSGLVNGTTYQVRVSPVTANGVGASSVILGTPATVPSAVTNVMATPASGKVTLSFKQPASTGGYGVDHYMVEVATSLTGPWTVAVENSGSALTRFDVPGLTNNKTYYLRVTPVNQIGKGPASAPLPVIPGGAATAPTLSTFTISAKTATVSWTAPKDTGGKEITKYIVEVSADGAKWDVAATTGGKSATVKLAKKAQLMRVRAVTSFGNGVPSLAIRLPGLGK